MEEPRQTKPTGIPRLSKIPVPGQTTSTSKLPVPRSNSIRTSPSRESLKPSTTTGQLRNPKLRTAASRDQLATAASSPVPVRSVSSPHTRASLSHTSGNARNAANKANPGFTPQPMRLLKPGGQPANQSTRSTSTSRAPKRQPSQQWISAATVDKPLIEEPEHTVTVEYVGDDVELESPPDSAKLRPSLSERTMETLSRLPSSPSVKGKAAASFFDVTGNGRQSPSRPGSRSSRPGSSHQSEGSSGHSRGSRPGSRVGLDSPVTSTFGSRIATYQTTVSTVENIPLRGRRSIQSFQLHSVKTPSKGVRTSVYEIKSPSTISFPRTRTPSPEKQAPDVAVSRFGAKTVATGLRKRQSVNGLMKKPSTPALRKQPPTETTRKASSASQMSSATSNEGTHLSGGSVVSGSTALTADSGDSTPGQAYRKASSALREQIAKAKAAKRAAASQQAFSELGSSLPEEPPLVPTDNSFDFGLHHDPFNQHRDDKSQEKVLRSRLETARTSGRLNIAAMGLREIPADVLNMYNLELVGQSGGAWAESVDLTRFVAADNELEMIAESVFPDIDPQEFADDEDSQGNIFLGLETLDLHGNMLISLPMGLRRLSLLTSLNLSVNRLANNSLEVISQITSLRDLKLGGNLLYGPLEPCFSDLKNLEILDLHGNNIASLPTNFGNLSRLRILNIGENGFETLPFETLAALPLTELIARKNQLRGTLVEEPVQSLPTLQILDVSSNQLAHICSTGRSIAMPALHQLCVSMNRLQSLPDIGNWAALHTIAADENSINAIPEGFTKLSQLRSVDFSSNDIRVIPAEIGQMESLAMLRLSGNPLREKKFSTMSTEEMKEILAQRLEPPTDFETQPEPQLEPQPEPHVEAQPEPPAEAQPELQPEPQIEPQPELQAAPRVEPQAQPAQTDGAEETPVPQVTGPVASHDDADDSRSDMDDFATPPTSAPASPARSRSQTITGQMWPVKPGGVLDRSNTESSSLHPLISSKVAASNQVKEIQLHHNLFTCLPESLTFFAETMTALSLAHNQLVRESYLGGASGNEKIELPALKELNLSHNHITGLGPLVAHLMAPNLEKIDVSFNRISCLPPGTTLRNAFPELVVLHISNNHLVELEPESIRGMRVVDASNNDIAHLNPRIGLLGGVLERLEVSGNRFRVPKWSVLERGTEATLRWLRGRVPVAERGEAARGEVAGEEVD
ncbi:hypothetical protein QC762_403240 [Podospora pseudocomata]|uniref:Leucine-rich repeat-containing protein 40 n=1 Tax=Podospora pseudocomata TaxID=2093779 RepID=A0ABR0GFW5_9PEZI|nr:hypothetical protein QC762_403240 [Podospora pseudocomata]